MGTMATSEALQDRIRTTQSEIDRLAERERAINEEVGALLAAGGDVTALRDERREVRDSVEDLTASLSHIGRQLEAARLVEARASFAAWVATEEKQVARAVAIGREMRPHLDALCALVPELSALVDEHRTMTRPKIDHCAQAAGEPRPARPDIVASAGLSSKLLDNTLRGLVHDVGQFVALHPELAEAVR